MHVGVAPTFMNRRNQVSDQRAWGDELRLVDLAEPLGFESIWATEHHFTDYELIPDNTMFLAHAAGRTKHALLGTMAIIVPWHDPLRVAESVSQLDTLSNGRVILGLGRGLGRVEFEGFRVPMEESRDRYDLFAPAILDALETGAMEYKNEYGEQPARDIRPAPFRSFKGRTYMASVSPSSFPMAAQLGAGLLVTPQKRWEKVETDISNYRSVYSEVNNGDAAPPPILIGYVMVDKSADRAESMARQYIGEYFRKLSDHYELTSDHFAGLKGYEHYAESGGFGLRGDSAEDEFVNLMPWGTPEQVLEKLHYIRELIDYNALVCHFRFGEMPIDTAEGNMRLFAESVLPELKTWQTKPLVVGEPLAELAD